MTHLTQNNLIKTCEAASQNATYAQIAASISAHESTLFNWRRQCLNAKASDSRGIWFFEWREGVWSYWTDKIIAAKNEYYMRMTAKIVSQIMDGIPEVCRGPDQHILYVERPETIGRSDDYIRQAEGLGDWEEVDRLARDEKGNPIPQVKISQVPAPLRLRALEAADPKFRSVAHQSVDVQVSGEIAIQKPLARLPGELPPTAEKMARLKALAGMSPADRRKELGASAIPTGSNGLIAPPERGRPDPVQPQPKRPAYARPLDSSGIGRGNPPEGGAPADGPGMVR